MFRKLLTLLSRLDEQEKRLDALSRAVSLGGAFKLTKRGYPIVADKSFARVYPNGCPDEDVMAF